MFERVEEAANVSLEDVLDPAPLDPLTYPTQGVMCAPVWAEAKGRVPEDRLVDGTQQPANRRL